MQLETEKTVKHVTNRNGVQLAQKARANGVSREDWVKFINDPKKLQKFFDELKNGDNWFERLQVEASKIGARVHLIPKLKVDGSRFWKDAVMAGGPQTGSGYNVLNVADKYQSSENKITDEVIILFNWINGGGSYQQAIEWGLVNNLEKTVPREVFAVGENFPNLNYELGPNPMYVVETTGCSFGSDTIACCVWWRGALRESDLRWQGIFGDGSGWFAFRKKISSQNLGTSAS